MIQAIGIDAVEIERFKNWHTFSHKKLSRIFSAHEIEYCLSNQKNAERFAARFAAKEALFKALSQLNIKIPFLTLCKTSEIINNPVPLLKIKHQNSTISDYTILVSLTHTETTAIAVVIITKITGF